MRCSERLRVSRKLLFLTRPRLVRATFFSSLYAFPSLHHAATAPRSAVAELGVVRRCYPHHNMRIHWLKLVIGAVAVEIAAVLVLVVAVALFGPHEATADQAYAEKLGRWLGPIAGTLFCFAITFWIARPLATGHLAHGALLGCLVAALDVAILVAMRAPFEWIFVISDTARLIAAITGAASAARHRAANNPP